MITYAPLRLFLHEHNITISDLISDLGLSSATASKIRKNKYLSMQTIVSISHKYNLSIDEIIYIGSERHFIEKKYLSSDYEYSNLRSILRD